MAQIRNYRKGIFETLALVPIGQATGGNDFIKADGVLTNAFSDLVLYTDAAGTAAVPLTDYSMTTQDTNATAKEAETGTGGSGKTVHSQYQVTNATYQGIDLFATFTNFGTYTDNDAIYQIGNRLGEMADFPFSVTDSGVQDLFATYGKYAVYCNGATIDKSTNKMYSDLVDMLKAEAGGDTGHPFYSSNANQAVLPDARGRVSRALDPSGTIDPDGAIRDLGDLQADAMQRITGNFSIIARSGGNPVTDVSGLFSDDGAVGPSTTQELAQQADTGNSYTLSFDSSDSTSPNPAKTDDDETRMSNIAVNKIIFYV